MNKVLDYLFKPVIPLISINSQIDAKAVRQVEKSLSKIKRAKALAVIVNSQGGFPVAADQIAFKLKSFSHHHKIPLYTFAEDQAVSAAYYILCAGDKIFVDPASQVGSIGVILLQMKIKELANTHGIELRYFQSNDQLFSSILSPTQEASESQIQTVDKELGYWRQQFIDYVRKNRPEIQKQPEEIQHSIFNANIFNGEDAVKYSIADGLGNYVDVLTKLYPECVLKDYTYQSFQSQMLEKAFN